MIQALNGLEAVHRAGIIHRDISPENIMLTRDPGGEERVKIIDMGVAKVEGSTENATVAGVFVGKLRYASPEHLGFLPEGDRIDARADLYSMAMVLYEMLTGRPPFEATSPHEYVMLHSRDAEFRPLDLPADLPGGAQLQAVLKKGLERDRNKRYSSAKEFASALEDVERSLPDPASQRTMNIPSPDTDATLHVTPLPQRDTLHRSTVRTPMPPFSIIPAESTQQETIVARQESSSAKAILFVVAIVIVAVVAIAYVLVPKVMEEVKPAPTATIASQTPPPPVPVRSTTSVDVVSPAPITTTTEAPIAIAIPPPETTTTATATAAPVTTTTAAPVPVQPATQTVAPVPRKPIEKPRPVEPPVEKPAPAPATVRAYIDGEGGDSDANDQMLSDLKRHLNGVTKVTVHANGDMLKPLTDYLKSEASEVTIVDGADTVVDFNGTVERLGRGKKRRSAQATVSKNGRVIFRYEMPPEEYRIGDTPAEAFAKILAEAFH